MDCLNQVTTAKEKEELKKKLKLVNKFMDHLNLLDNDEVKKIVAELRIKYLNLIE